jgi:hypothetical protein
MSKPLEVIEPFLLADSLRPCYATTVLRATLEIQPMRLVEIYEETGLPQECIIQELPAVAVRGHDGRYYPRKPNSFCMHT